MDTRRDDGAVCGGVALDRLAGNTLAVSTSGGHVRVRVCYSDALQVDTRGGAFSASHLKCAESRVHSGGGPIQISSLDGACDLNSGGGAVDVQVRVLVRALCAS